ncbi:MAG TPA: hypothetical protein VJY34_13210 [Roseiarcus sp.]|nr:hypothetical protein [Roseiarcus sp.]
MKAFVVLASAAAIGRPAWSRDAWRATDSNPYELNNNPHAHYDDPYPGTGATDGDLSNFSAGSLISLRQGFPPLGPTTPGAPVH